MAELTLQIPLPPMTLNHSHRLVKIGGRASRIKTPAFKAWESKFLCHLREFEDIKFDLTSAFDERKHSIELEMIFYIKHDRFMTLPKNGFKRISKTSGDLSNMIKTSEDQVFNWLDINDAMVTRLITEKVATMGEDSMFIRVRVIPIPDVVFS